MLVFAWDHWNYLHSREHGVSPDEAMSVVRNAPTTHVRNVGGSKRRAWGQTSTGRYIQVVYTILPDERVDVDSLSLEDLIEFSEGRAEVVYVIHAMPLTPSQISQFHKR